MSLISDPGLMVILPTIIFTVIAIVFFVKYVLQRKVRLFLHKPLPCSLNTQLFPKPKSVFDIFLDLGISVGSLDLVSKRLWPMTNGRLDHAALDAAVSSIVEEHGTYPAFINLAKAEIRGILGDTVPILTGSEHDTIWNRNFKTAAPLEKLLEERQVFNAMFAALRDETKDALARKLGISHRFDYLTGELFSSFAENKKKHIAASLDFETYSNADVLVAFGKLSAVAGGGMLVLEAASEIMGQASGAFGGEGAEGMFGETGLEGLGEAALVLGAVLFTAGKISKLGKYWRERKLKKYQSDFKNQLGSLAKLFEDHREEALKVPRKVILALEIELSRIAALEKDLKRQHASASPLPHRLAIACSRDALRLYGKMRKKFTAEIDIFYKNLLKFDKSGRRDMVGLQLYFNRHLAFLPSHVPNEFWVRFERTQNELFGEVVRLQKAS